MNIKICSREAAEKLLRDGFPANTAVISFFDPPSSKNKENRLPVNYSGKAERVFQVALYDIDFIILDKYGFTYETYFPEVDKLAEFIFSAKEDGLDIICQCEYGQSRSSGCAAAILEYFYKSGISVFADYNYYPNQIVYNKVFEALSNFVGKMGSSS